MKIERITDVLAWLIEEEKNRMQSIRNIFLKVESECYLVACLLLLASSMSGLEGASATDGTLCNASSVATTGLCRGDKTPSTRIYNKKKHTHFYRNYINTQFLHSYNCCHVPIYENYSDIISNNNHLFIISL